MKKTMKLFEEYCNLDGKGMYALRLYSDWSGRVVDDKDEWVLSFISRKELIKRLTKEIKKANK